MFIFEFWFDSFTISWFLFYAYPKSSSFDHVTDRALDCVEGQVVLNPLDTALGATTDRECVAEEEQDSIELQNTEDNTQKVAWVDQ